MHLESPRGLVDTDREGTNATDVRNFRLTSGLARPHRSFGSLVKWAIAIPTSVMMLIGLYIVAMDSAWMHDPNVIRPILLVALFFATAHLIRAVIRWRGAKLVGGYLSRFDRLNHIDTYEISYPRIFTPRGKLPHAVLLLHGYTGSPQEFDNLLTALKDAGIPYYSPQFTGFGLSTVDLLYSASASDWARDALSAYDRISAFTERVSVVGHSMGAVLATFIAEHRPVHHLVLSGPGHYPNRNDAAIAAVLGTPVVSSIVQWFIPLLPKPIRRGRASYADLRDSEAAKASFQYVAVPIRSAFQVLKAQAMVDIRKITARDLTIVWGRDDQTVDVPRLLRFLDAHDVKYASYALEDSGHNTFEDYDKDKAISIVLDVFSDVRGGADPRPIRQVQAGA
jgi:esterase/lipase